MKSEIQKPFNELKEFNVTQMIRKEWLEKGHIKDILPLIKDMDFGQESKKDIHFQESSGQIHYTKVSESLAENIIDSLPFEAYQDLITYEWLNIEEKNGTSFINKCLWKKKIELIEKLGDLGFQAVKEKKLSSQEYQNNYINLITSLEDLFPSYDNSKEDTSYYNKLYPVFIKGLQYYQKNLQLIGIKKISLNDKNWAFQINYNYSRGLPMKSENEKIIKTLTVLSEQPHATDFIKDAFNQLKLEQKEDLLIGWNAQEIIKISLKKINTFMLDKILEIDSNSIKVIVEETNQKIDLKNMINPNMDRVESYINYIKYHKVEELYKWLNDNAKNNSIDYYGLLLNQQLKEELIPLVDIDKTIIPPGYAVNEGFRLKDFMIMKNLINDYMNENPKLFNLKAGEAFGELSQIQKDFENDLTDKELLKKFKDIISLCYGDDYINTIKGKEIDSWFNAHWNYENLSKNLENKPKSSKLKI